MIRTDNFILPNGGSAGIYTLENSYGGRVRISDWGGVLVSLEVPDRDGRLVDVVLGWKDLGGYFENPGYLGALVGRVANRIAGGKFELDGVTFELGSNDADRPNSLHGGGIFSHRRWQAEKYDGRQLSLALDTPDGDGGFPGNMHVEVVYEWNDSGELSIEYRAVSDAPTLVNMTSHAYFNLNGEASNDISGLSMRIAADEYNPVDSALIPVGTAPVGREMPDLRRLMSFEEILEVVPRGLDHNFILGRTPRWRENCAEVRSAHTGIVMTVSTDRTGVQVYMGGGLGGARYGEGKHGFYRRFAGFCLETQEWPDAPHHPDFPSIILRPGGEYRARTVYRFNAEK